jgi:hypothetical protein
MFNSHSEMMKEKLISWQQIIHLSHEWWSSKSRCQIAMTGAIRATEAIIQASPTPSGTGTSLKVFQKKIYEFWSWYILYCLNYLADSTEKGNFREDYSCQLIKKFISFYGTWKFDDLYTTIHHWAVLCASWIQSTLSHPSSLRSV